MTMAGECAAIDRMRRMVDDPFAYSAVPYDGVFEGAEAGARSLIQLASALCHGR